MRLLLDQTLSPLLADELVAKGHDVVHVRELGLSAASDIAVMDAASGDGRVVVSASAHRPSRYSTKPVRRPRAPAGRPAGRIRRRVSS